MFFSVAYPCHVIEPLTPSAVQISKLGVDAVFRGTTEVKSQILDGNLSVAQIMELLRTFPEAAFPEKVPFQPEKETDMATTRNDNRALGDLSWPYET